MPQYPKGSKLLYMSSSPHMDIVETKLIELFSNIFIQRTDRGREYFQGDYNLMKKFMENMIEYYDILNPVVINKETIKQQIKASTIIQKYWRLYRLSKKNKNEFIKIKNFLISSRIINKKDGFLKTKDVRLLWNANNEYHLTDIEISNRLSFILGDIIIQNGILGWKNKVLQVDEIQIKDNNDDLWDNFIIKYLIKEDNSLIKWKDLRETFRIWHDSKFPNKLSKRADNAKKYFNHILGGFKETSSNKTPFKGYIGWKLK